MKSETTGKLVESLSIAQGQIKAAGKSGKNPRFNSNYSTVEDLWNSCRKPLSENGLAITQILENEGNNYFLSTLLMHTSGEWIKSKMPLLLPKFDSQALGSAITYAKKYSLSAMLGIASSDDDVEDIDTDDDGEACRASDKPKTDISLVINKQQIDSMQEFFKVESDIKQKVIALLKAHNIRDLAKVPAALYAKIEPMMKLNNEEIAFGGN